MHGNVWEWVQDNWHNSYRGAPTDGHPWEDVAGLERVVRRGSWIGHARDCRSARRGRWVPNFRGSNVGFRLARGPQPAPERASR